MRTERSRALYERARRVVPAGVHSNTRWRQPHPLYFQRAQGPYLWDLDGERHVDLVMGNGAVVLGHGDPRVNEAVRRQLETGLTTGVESELGVLVAERLLSMVPGMEMVRFANSGTEAAMHALMVARSATGRRRVAKVEGSYHGWYDPLYVSVWMDPARAGPASRPLAVPGTPGLDERWAQETLVLPFNNLPGTRALMEEYGPELAAVVVEPVLIDIGFVPADPAYLRGLRELCTRMGVVLIFDELLTGFRLAPGGAQQLYGVTADLTLYGKAIANGYPIAAMAGREELMRLTEPGPGHPAYVGTFNGHAVALAAAAAALEALRDGTVQEEMDRRTRWLRESFESEAARLGVPARLVGAGGHLHWYFAEGPFTDYRDAARSDPEMYRRFTASLAEQGFVVLPGVLSHHALSAAHDDAVVEQASAAMARALEAAIRDRGPGQTG